MPQTCTPAVWPPSECETTFAWLDLESGLFLVRFRFAHIAFARCLAASRCSGEKFRFLRAFGLAAATAASAFFNGRPLRFAGLPSASIALFSLSLSAIRRAMM